VDFLLLFKAVDYMGYVVGDSFYALRLVVKHINMFLVVAELHLPLSQLIFAWIIETLKMEIIHLLLQNFSPLLEIHDLLFI
jgi:hypothetical protein